MTTLLSSSRDWRHTLAKNRYYTLMIVPEKTSQVRKILIPAWLVRSFAVGMGVACVIAGLMLFDYWYVMGQINENKDLRLENRRLRQQVQVFRNKLTSIESTLDRVRAFSTRLKVITNIEDRGSLLQTLNQGKIPDAAKNLGGPTTMPLEATLEGQNSTPVTPSAPALLNLADLDTAALLGINPEDLILQREYAALDQQFTLLGQNALQTEQGLQDLYELLVDQKTVLASLPVRKPAKGYLTSGFGVRHSPFGDRVKMHEGLDIANRPGTDVIAPADGTVIFADTKSGYGQTIILDHGYGLETWFAHNSKLVVQKGQRVRRGENISKIGSTGRSTGPHLHYEVRFRGLPVNPDTYILED